MATATKTRPSEIETVEITMPDGKTTGPIPSDEFEDRAQAASDRLRAEHRQLSFDVGARGDAPEFGSLKLSGSLNLTRDLKRRQALTVVVSDPRTGEVICERSATVTAIGFKDSTDKYGTTTERQHTATID